jgi:hypothetical protein
MMGGLSGHHQQRRDHLTATGWSDAYELQLFAPPGLDIERIFVAELDLAEPSVDSTSLMSSGQSLRTGNGS